MPLILLDCINVYCVYVCVYTLCIHIGIIIQKKGIQNIIIPKTNLLVYQWQNLNCWLIYYEYLELSIRFYVYNKVMFRETFTGLITHSWVPEMMCGLSPLCWFLWVDYNFNVLPSSVRSGL